MDINPGPTIVMFPAEAAARDFNAEKWEPMIMDSPWLIERFPIRSRSKEATVDRKTFPGGFIKFVGANSTRGVKSTAARYLIVEEPDDCNRNLKGQGDSIGLLRERGKTFDDSLMLIGGTPTIEGLSAIEKEMQLSDQRRWMVPCHICHERAELDWVNVKWDVDKSLSHPVYGSSVPVTARYECPCCGTAWSDSDKHRNVRRGEWIATAPFTGIAGFYFSELLSPFPASRLEELVKKYLEAHHDFAKGDVAGLVRFHNATLGKPWRYASKLPPAEALEARAEAYQLWTVPAGGIIVTMGVDVQHDRLYYVVRAWGPGEESWLIAWGEILGNPVDKSDGCWGDLDELVEREFEHESGSALCCTSVSIDCGDGVTSDAVYSWVRRTRTAIAKNEARRLLAMPIKGSTVADREIFSKPKEAVDAAFLSSKSARYGLRPYMVGVARAKDLLIGYGESGGRINLQGTGPGRLHWPKEVRSDYWQHITAEIKAPDARSKRATLVWQLKSGRENHALDCEVYALHAFRALGLERWTAAKWEDYRRKALAKPENETKKQKSLDVERQMPDKVKSKMKAGKWLKA